MKTWYNDATTNFHTFRNLDEPKKKHGRELAVGDVVICGGKESHTITKFTEHPGLESYGKFYTARVLWSGDYGITCFDDDLWVMTSGGAYISAHLWWHHEKRGAS